ncbi:MAG: isopenicillin N synthase family oxygenase [Acidobacteria bacterium]|nr:isopenicillin N synthase family oxygenase [Acidobacteriota bacterium]
MNPLALAREFFALPDADKDRVHIRRSLHLRGYSVMKNERDWREQIHFGLEGSPGASLLERPNLWPGVLGAAWREQTLSFLDEAGRHGQQLLASLGLPVSGADEPYLLMKMICYHPQPEPDRPRPGVAAHCDWSWITLLYQDDTGGLEQQEADGTRREVSAPISVTIGELAEIYTGGRLRATPHGVVNRSITRQRISIPVFICPPLDAVMRGTRHCFSEAHGHVHRVRNPAEPYAAVSFGESEWRRKGLGQWCWRSSCLG